MEPTGRTLPRAVIGDFINSPRGIRAFEDLQGDSERLYAAVDQAQFLTLGSDPSLGSERALVLTDGDLVADDGGANASYTLSLASTAITAGSFGDASHLVKVTFDAKGRATNAEAFELNSDNVTEGTTNRFFTNARARSALSDGTGIDYDSDTGEIALDTNSKRNVDHSDVQVIAGAGLSGGGSIDDDVTISLPSVVAAGTYASPTSITIDNYGRVTAIS